MAADEEQVDALKKWWSENGKGLVAGVGIGLAGVLGWSSWQTWQRNQAELASLRYEQLAKDATSGNHAQALSQADALVDDFPDSVYAALASLLAARTAVATNAPDKARQHLGWVIDHAPLPEFVPIARIRLARLMFDTGDHDGALSELDRIDSASFRNPITELRGDIHRARGDRAAARESYETVLAGAELPQTTRARVRMKLDDLGELTSRPSS